MIEGKERGKKVKWECAGSLNVLDEECCGKFMVKIVKILNTGEL